MGIIALLATKLILIISNAFNLNTKKEDFFTVIFKDFYIYSFYNPKIVLILKFLDTEILLNMYIEEIDKAEDFFISNNQYKLITRLNY